jgi:hypothetical protein
VTINGSQDRSSPKLASLRLLVLDARLRSPVHSSATDTSLLCDDSSGPFRRMENWSLFSLMTCKGAD